MPEVGADSTILSVWFADVGEPVFEGDRLVEVLVGGATFDVPAPATGRLAEKRTLPDDPLRPGQDGRSGASEIVIAGAQLGLIGGRPVVQETARVGRELEHAVAPVGAAVERAVARGRVHLVRHRVHHRSRSRFDRTPGTR